MAEVRAGWYRDPAGGGGLRWFDGERWTGQTRALPATPTTPHPADEPAPASRPEHASAAPSAPAARPVTVSGRRSAARPSPSDVAPVATPSAATSPAPARTVAPPITASADTTVPAPAPSLVSSDTAARPVAPPRADAVTAASGGRTVAVLEQDVVALLDDLDPDVDDSAIDDLAPVTGGRPGADHDLPAGDLHEADPRALAEGWAPPTASVAAVGGGTAARSGPHASFGRGEHRRAIAVRRHTTLARERIVRRENPRAWLGVLFGVIGIVIPVLVVPSILAIVFGVLGLSRAAVLRRGELGTASGRTYAWAAIVIGAASLVLFGVFALIRFDLVTATFGG